MRLALHCTMCMRVACVENRTGDRNSQGQMDGGVEKGKGISPSEDRTDLVAAVITHPHTHRERQRERERERGAEHVRTVKQARRYPERGVGDRNRRQSHTYTLNGIWERDQKKKEKQRGDACTLPLTSAECPLLAQLVSSVRLQSLLRPALPCQRHRPDLAH